MNGKNEEYFTEWIKSNHKNVWPITRWTKRIAKMRRIKSFGKMSKEELIISLLKLKTSLAELFNNNLDYDKISDGKKMLNKLRDILPRKYRK